jgi:regulator of nucleoside diphosphate kinase
MHRTFQRGVNASTDIILTRGDHARLEKLLREHAPIRSWKAVAFLIEKMEAATIVDDEEIEPIVVTMNARVAFREDDNNDTTIATLTLPGAGGLYPDALSVLTPIGAALIGLAEGQSSVCKTPEGLPRTITVVDVLYQPQALSRAARFRTQTRRPARSSRRQSVVEA